jgi:hypothetical protein
MWKRATAGVIGVLALIGGVLGCGYASMAVPDFFNPGVSVWAALFGDLALWLLTVGAFWMGGDFLKFSISGRHFQLPPGKRAAVLGVLSFFPGFLLAFLIGFTYVSLRWANNSNAAIGVVLVSVILGFVFAVTIGMLLLKRKKSGLSE